jgi:hypothetical protein
MPTKDTLENLYQALIKFFGHFFKDIESHFQRECGFVGALVIQGTKNVDNGRHAGKFI